MCKWGLWSAALRGTKSSMEGGLVRRRALAAAAVAAAAASASSRSLTILSVAACREKRNTPHTFLSVEPVLDQFLSAELSKSVEPVPDTWGAGYLAIRAWTTQEGPYTSSC